MQAWKALGSKVVFEHKWIKLRQDTVQLPSGRILDDYFIVVGSEVAMIVPVTNEGKFILTKQYRYALDDFVVEFPAGGVDSGEDTKAAALRELREETGYTATSVTHLATLASNPARSGNKVHLFLAQNVEKKYEVKLDESEIIETLICSAQELRAMVENGDIYVSSSVAAVYLALDYLEKH